jgi:pimeloyl-ACP methyl ester carboxylesterase
VVLVPGFVSNIDLYWDNPGWRQVFDRLTTFCRLILWDKRGTGLSDSVHRVPTLDERVEDLLAVMDAAESHHATLLGISEGGPMSLLFAASHPDRTHSLVLYGVSPRFSQARDWAWGWAPAKVASVLAELDAAWGEGALLDLFAPTHAGDDTARRSWGRTQRAGASPAMGRAVMEAMVTLDCRDILTAVRVPTLLLHRRDDQVAHIEAARYMAAHIPGARLVEFPGTNHLITMGHLEPLLDQIEDFVTTGADRPATDQLLATLLAATIVSPTAAAPRAVSPIPSPTLRTSRTVNSTVSCNRNSRGSAVSRSGPPRNAGSPRSCRPAGPSPAPTGSAPRSPRSGCTSGPASTPGNAT